LWHAMGPRETDLIVARWPLADAHALDSGAAQEIDWLIRLVSEIRAARAELNVPPGAKMALHVREGGALTAERLTRQAAALGRMARVETISHDAPPEGGTIQIVVDEATYMLPLAGTIDLDAERARIAKAIEAAAKERDSLAGRLNNPSFVERAKPEAVDKARADHAEKSAEADRLQAALARLG